MDELERAAYDFINKPKNNKQKMKVSKNVANAIDLFLDGQVRVMKRSIEQGKSILVAEHCGQDWSDYEDGQYTDLNEISTFDLMKCLVNGYEIV